MVGLDGDEGAAGPDPDYGRRLARLESWGAGGADDSWRAASLWRQLNLPQIRLEPLLKARAEELSPGRIRFGHELTGLERIGHLDGDLYDPRCTWLRQRQIASGGAVLVRPDRFIPWPGRSARPSHRQPDRTRSGQAGRAPAEVRGTRSVRK